MGPNQPITGFVKFMSVVVDIIWVISIISLISGVLFMPAGWFLFRSADICMDFNFDHGLHGLPFIAPLFIGMAYITNILASGIILWIVHHFRLLIKKVKSGEPFHERNPRLIRKIAIGVLVWGPIRMMSFAGWGLFMLGGIDFPRLAMMSHFTPLTLELIFIGLGILLIAQVFEYGCKLQAEQDLTV
ncbi:DUF2975 domain-containing protein [bacterium]|nr:DUF2975 domain-containing protein [bacterium]